MIGALPPLLNNWSKVASFRAATDMPTVFSKFSGGLVNSSSRDRFLVPPFSQPWKGSHPIISGLQSPLEAKAWYLPLGLAQK
jgi:hypothetical protein